MSQLWATKSLSSLQGDAGQPSALRRTLGAWDLTMLGLGGVVGTGVFVLTGRAAAANAGPAVTLSFAIGAVAAALAALCYAEMASMIPVSGSAYTYAYATMGELVAFVIGWDLVLEYGVAASTVCVGWSGYVGALVTHLTGYALPAAWSSAPIVWDTATASLQRTGAYLNAPAVAIILLVTATLARGTRVSMQVTARVVFIKIAVILLFIVSAAFFVRAENLHPFIPPNTGVFGQFGISGVFQGATMVFFSYCGFDAVSTAAQESRRPQRDIPIGILVSLVVATILYVAVSFVLTGIVPYQKLSVAQPIAVGIAATGLGWLETVIEVGAIAGLTSVLMVQIYGQTRIFFTMSQDGLLPAAVSRVSAKRGTPVLITWVTGAVVALGGGLLPIDILGELTSIGTLFAFVLVSIGVMLMRLRYPNAPRLFRVPFGPYVLPLSSVMVSTLLMYTATTHTIMRLFIWMALGLLVYGLYGYRHSKLSAAAKS